MAWYLAAPLFLYVNCFLFGIAYAVSMDQNGRLARPSTHWTVRAYFCFWYGIGEPITLLVAITLEHKRNSSKQACKN